MPKTKNRMIRMTLMSLATMDRAKLDNAFAIALEQVTYDCELRKGEDKKRTIDIKVSFTPVVGQDGDLLKIDVKWQVKTSAPALASRMYEAFANQKQLMFDDLNPESGD